MTIDYDNDDNPYNIYDKSCEWDGYSEALDRLIDRGWSEEEAIAMLEEEKQAYLKQGVNQ